MYCSNCGNQISEEANFCSHCGTPLKDTSQRAKPTDRVADNAPNRQRGKEEFDQGKAYFDEGQYKLAVDFFSKAVQETPDEAEFHGWLARALAATENYTEALKAANNAIELDPACAVAFFSRGNIHLNQNDYEPAIADYTGAIELGFTGAVNNRGNARSDKGDLDGAIADYTEAIRLDPNDSDAFNDRGNARSDRGDLDGAIADYTEAVRLDPNNAMAYNNRGNAYKATGDLNRATDDYNEALQLKRKNQAQSENIMNSAPPLTLGATVLVASQPHKVEGKGFFGAPSTGYVFHLKINLQDGMGKWTTSDGELSVAFTQVRSVYVIDDGIKSNLSGIKKAENKAVFFNSQSLSKEDFVDYTYEFRTPRIYFKQKLDKEAIVCHIWLMPNSDDCLYIRKTSIWNLLNNEIYGGFLDY